MGTWESTIGASESTGSVLSDSLETSGVSVSTITWLHLSDLHCDAQQAWDENIVLRALLEDLEEKCIGEYALTPDLILVSGDIAYSGAADDYEQARSFFDRLLAVTGLPSERLFLVPGNHDVDRKSIRFGARAVVSACEDRAAINRALDDEEARRLVLRKFDSYAGFVRDYLSHIPFDDDSYFYAHSLDLAGGKIAILGLNSAWLSCDDEDHKRLALGEKQVRKALDDGHGADLSIAVLHHPFDCLQDSDREVCESLLMDRCDFVLCGHLHRARLLMQRTPDARAMYVTAGACYEARQYPNSYNLVRLDREAKQGRAFLRAWSNRQAGFWTRDAQTYRNVEDGEYPFSLGENAPILRHERPSVGGSWIRDTQIYSDTEDGEFAFPLGEYLQTISLSGDSLQFIVNQFCSHTERALRQIRLSIPGIAKPVPREEVTRVEEQLQRKKQVVLVGDAGVGKSGIGAKLARAAMAKGVTVLLLDARRVGHVQSDAELREHFDLKEPVSSAVELVGRYNGCRLIIDQLDSAVGSVSAGLLVDLAIDCSELQGVEVIVISRKRETQEARLIEKLTRAGLTELGVYPLSESSTMELLGQLDIAQPSAGLIGLGVNLLNLELIGTIRQQRPDSDVSDLTNEVDLWHQYIRTLLDQEELTSDPETAGQIIAEAVKLARSGVNSEDRAVNLDYPLTRPHRRLISWGIIVHDDGWIYRFRHEKLQDFLCAWDATQRHLMPIDVLGEINVHRTRNVFTWMDKIYSRRSPHIRKQFLRKMLDV